MEGIIHIMSNKEKKSLNPAKSVAKAVFHQVHKNKSLKPELNLRLRNVRAIFSVNGVAKTKYSFYLDGQEKKFYGGIASVPLTKKVLNAIENGKYKVVATGYGKTETYTAEDDILKINPVRVAKVGDDEYVIDEGAYVTVKFDRNGDDLCLNVQKSSINGKNGDLCLYASGKNYVLVEKINIVNGKCVIKNIDEVVEKEELLHLTFMDGNSALKTVVLDFDDDKIDAKCQFDLVTLKPHKESYNFDSTNLTYPVAGMKPDYVAIKAVSYDNVAKKLVIEFNDNYKAGKTFDLFVKSVKTNERQLHDSYKIADTIEITDVDKILDREINLIDRFFLEFEIKDEKDEVKEVNYLKIKQPVTRNMEDYVLLESHGNRLGFLDKLYLIVENKDNHFTYAAKDDFTLTSNTFATDFEINEVSDTKVNLNLQVYSLMSKIKKIVVWLEDNYMKKSYCIFEQDLDGKEREYNGDIEIDVEEIGKYFYYNSRLNFKLGVEYVGGFKESGFILKKNKNYSVADRYLYKKLWDEDMVTSLYLGANLYNLNVWYTSVDEYEKGVKYQTGREKYFETLKNEDMDEKLIFFEANLGKNYTGNPKYLYEYMRSHEEYSDYKYVWTYPDTKSDKIPYNPILVERGTPEYFYYLAKAHYWVNNILFPVKEKRTETVYLQTWHGTPLKKLGFDIECEGPEKQAFGNLHKESLNWDYFLADNDYGEEKLVGAFRFKKHVIKKGYPINDIFYDEERKNRVISRIHNDYPAINGKKVILYAPTWRDLQGDYVRGYDFELPFDVDKLFTKFGKEYVVLVKLHHLIADNLEIDEKYKDFLINVSSEEDVMELLCLTDVLITDYSSVFYDFASAKKPILFYAYDLEEYINETRGLYVGMDTLPGPILKNNDELIKAIDNIDKYTYKSYGKLKQFCDEFAKYCKGHSCKDVLDIVLKK